MPKGKGYENSARKLANTTVNIQASNTLINYDSPWNPSVAEQRRGRIHRIGSEHDVVTFIDLISNGTIDETIQATQKKKEELGEGLVEKDEDEMAAMAELINELREE